MAAATTPTKQTSSRHDQYELVVGMEVHAQLLTRSKMFCSCATDYAGAPPNTRVCPVCLGMPGMLPVINRVAVEATIKTGLALNCTISPLAVFSRKNYTYPDLPKGYQITQYDLPSCEYGWIDVELESGETKRIHIRRAHIEEDTGKTVHASGYSLVDLNRAGVPLLEIVTEADIHSAEEAYAYLSKLRTILRYLGVNSGDMEKGALRCEPNISVRTYKQKERDEYGTKVEVKNLNSFRSVRSAIEYEFNRQINVIEAGGVIEQVNMGWDEAAQKTVLQRSKESAHDYRYFPEPDLPPLNVGLEMIEKLRAQLPELPDEKRQRYVDAWQVRAMDADILISESTVATYFESAAESYGISTEEIEAGKPQRIANWMTGEIFRLLRADGDGQDLRQIAAIKIQPSQLADLLTMVDEKIINQTTARKVLDTMFETGDSSQAIVEREGLAMVSDTSLIDETISKILDANPDELARYRGGEEKLYGFFMGQVMREMKGKADPNATKQRLGELLKG